MKVLKAHKQAVEYLNSSPTAGNEIIAKAFKLSEVKDVNGKMHSGVEVVAKARERLGWGWKFTSGDKAFIQQLMNYSLQLGYIKKPLKAEQLLDTSFIDKL